MSFEVDPKAVIQTVTLNDEALKFPTPMTMCVCGPSQVKQFTNS